VRIQGSCCSPMDWDHDREQVRDLRRYHAIAAIPALVAGMLTKRRRSAYTSGIQATT
jgi:hypothetical protein